MVLRWFRNNLFPVIFIFIITVILTFDLFYSHGQETTFDGPTHIANIAQIHAGLAEGDFPVRWGGGFARYGLPIPLIAQQTTSYLGAFFTFFTKDIFLSYNLVYLLGAFLSSIFLYIFLRLYVSEFSALAGTLLFHFAPYRIMNIYIRGALPEFFASVFIILILISLYVILEKKRLSGYLLLSLSTGLLLLTHVFMFVVGCFIFIPYSLYLLYKSKEKFKSIILMIISLGVGVGLAAYYIIPLFLEIKYFYYGQSIEHFTSGHFLTWKNYFMEQWEYFGSDVATRSHIHNGGIIETLILIITAVYGGVVYYKKKTLDLIHVFLLSGIIIVFFTVSFSESIYKLIVPLGNIQHPWRMLTGYILIPPILLAFTLERIQHQKAVLFILIFVIAILRFPQLYTKNNLQVNQQSYYTTDYNLHGVILNTIWMGKERDYPYPDHKVAIIGGEGEISNLTVKNSSRTYTIESDTRVNIVDHTFYFPGWRTYIDTQEIPIQFQDPNYRGVITYEVPSGKHTVATIFTNTKVRLLANIISFVFIILYITALMFSKRIRIFLSLK